MRARITSRCPECGETIREGTLIQKVGEFWVHELCPLPKTPPICGGCHMTMPCECD